VVTDSAAFFFSCWHLFRMTYMGEIPIPINTAISHTSGVSRRVGVGHSEAGTHAVNGSASTSGARTGAGGEDEVV
jgi:hypothetical protein